MIEAIIQACIRSTNLQGKVLKDFDGQSVPEFL